MTTGHLICEQANWLMSFTCGTEGTGSDIKHHKWVHRMSECNETKREKAESE